MSPKKPIRDLADLRAYRRHRDPEGTANRPTAREAHADRQRTDYRLRSRVLRGRGTPPNPEYRAARQRLEQARQQAREENR